LLVLLPLIEWKWFKLRKIELVVSCTCNIFLALVWLEIPNNNEIAKLIYVLCGLGSLTILLFSRSMKSHKCALLIVCLSKPILLVSGKEWQLLIALELLVLMILHSSFFVGTTGYYRCLILQFASQLFFYRSSHRERFNSLQFGKIYLGFTEYNYYLHSILLILNTFHPILLVHLVNGYTILRHKEEMNKYKKTNTRGMTKENEAYGEGKE